MVFGCGYSGEEAAAAGHCGNVGNKSGDNIISLRDLKNNVYMTFIVNVNTGLLGEAKAVNNQKPTKAFHPAIVALLLSGYVKNYKGGGYLPEKNFHIDDLDEKAKELVLSHFEKNIHKIPNNYLSLNYLDSWNQAKVDALSLKDKIKLLDDIIKIFANHKPLSIPYNEEEKKDFIPYTNELNFNFDKLVKETLFNMKNIKKLVDIVKGISEIKSDNEIYDCKAIEIWHNIPEEEAREQKLLKKDEYRYKLNSFKISNKTMSEIIKFLINLAQKVSAADKVKIYDCVQNIGEPYEDYEAIRNHTEEPNKYQNELKIIAKDVFNDVIKDDKVLEREVVSDWVNNTLNYELNKINNTLWVGFNREKGKSDLVFHIPSIFNKYKNLLEDKIIKIYPNIKNILIKNGMVQAIEPLKKSSVTDFTKPNLHWFVQKVVNYYNNNEEQGSYILSNFKRKYPNNKSRIKKINEAEFVMEFKTKDLIEKILYDPKIIKEYIDFFEECNNNYFNNKVLKTLENVIKNNAKEIVASFNKQVYKKGSYRDRKRHSAKQFESFIEYVKTRISEI